MNNRLAMALAVAGGYALGRTKKGKLALGLGGMVLGKRLNINPQALARLAGEQLLNNPQLKEVGDQVRQDLRGVGKAATGAVVNRRIDSLADALHQRTLNVQDQLSGAPRPDKKLRADENEDEGEEDEGREERDEAEDEREEPEDREDRERRRPAARARKTTGKTAGKAAKTARGTAPGKPPAPKKRTTAKSAAKKTTAARGGVGRPKGGEGRD